MNKKSKYLPKVSIVIPVYNGSNFLAEAIDSALSQTYKNIEVLVINDGSTDGGATDKIAKTYGKKIRYFKKPNGGVSTALNLGLKNMTGDYFSWLSHDDMYEKNKIAKQVEYLNKINDDTAIIVSNVSVLFQNGIKKRDYIDERTFKFTDIFLATSAVVGLNGCSPLIPKNILLDVGGFDASLPYTQDYDCWFKLTKRVNFYLLKDHLVISRRHDKQDSVSKQRLCFLASESLHYDFLSQIPHARFEKFFSSDKRNIDGFIRNYEVYRDNCYTKTASLMLKHLLKYLYINNRKKFDDLFRSEVGETVVRDNFLVDSKKPTIVLFSNVWHRGGIERVLSYMMGHFHNTYRFILVNYKSGNDHDQGYPLSSQINRIKIDDRRQIAAITNIVSLFDAKIFIGNPNFISSFLDIYEALRNMSVRTVAYNHGYYFLPYMLGKYLYPTALKFKESYSKADCVVWLTEFGYQIYSIENKNAIYIANPAHITNTSRSKANPPQKNILAVGRFEDELKRIDKILLVFRSLYQIDQKYKLKIVGNCRLDMILPGQGISLADFIDREEIPADNIEFVGRKNKVDRYYNWADFLLMTSRCEGFPMVLAEAMSKGVPCAGLHYFGIEDIIKNGVNGFVRDQEDLAGLASDIDSALNNSKAYKSMSDNAIKLIGRFNENVFYKKWSLLFKFLVNQNSEITSLPKELKISKSMSMDNYNKVVCEYERILNDVIKSDLTTNSNPLDNSCPPFNDRLKNIKNKLFDSLKNDGVVLTCKRIVYKVVSKIKPAKTKS